MECETQPSKIYRITPNLVPWTIKTPSISKIKTFVKPPSSIKAYINTSGNPCLQGTDLWDMVWEAGYGYRWGR